MIRRPVYGGVAQKPIAPLETDEVLEAIQRADPGPVQFRTPANEEEGCEEEDDDDLPEPTELLCLNCMEPIAIDEDAALLQLVEPFWDEAEAKIKYMVILDNDGEPQLEPVFLDFHCYEDLVEEVKQMDEDVPPREELGSALTCDFCQSSIRMGEKCLTLQIGEVIRDKRLSETTSFLASAEPDLLCLSCGHGVMETAGVEDVGTSLSQNGECADCTRATCWRRGRCMCRCHYGDS